MLVPKAPEFSRTASGFNGLYFRSYVTYQRNYFSELLTDWVPGHTVTTWGFYVCVFLYRGFWVQQVSLPFSQQDPLLVRTGVIVAQPSCGNECLRRPWPDYTILLGQSLLKHLSADGSCEGQGMSHSATILTNQGKPLITSLHGFLFTWSAARGQIQMDKIPWSV